MGLMGLYEPLFAVTRRSLLHVSLFRHSFRSLYHFHYFNFLPFDIPTSFSSTQIFNTCSIRERADSKLYSALGRQVRHKITLLYI